jgi:acetyl-CoA carboxylase/biotin carboxylase 1
MILDTIIVIFETRRKVASVFTPSNFFQAQELLLDEEGKLAPGFRVIDSNDVGILSWLLNVKTPEYPEGHKNYY